MSVRRSESPRPGDPSEQDPVGRSVWLAITLLAAAIVGIMAGALAWIGGANPAQAIGAGGGSFTAATILGLMLVQFMIGPRR